MKKLFILILLFSCSTEQEQLNLSYKDAAGDWIVKVLDSKNNIEATFTIIRASKDISSTNGTIKQNEFYVDNVQVKVDGTQVVKQSFPYPLKRYLQNINDIVLYYLDTSDLYKTIEFKNVIFNPQFTIITSDNYSYKLIDYKFNLQIKRK